MGSNINVSITADTTSLRAQMAVAQAAMRDYRSELQSAAAAVRAASEPTSEQATALSKAAAAYNDTASKIAGFKAALSGGAQGVGTVTAAVKAETEAMNFNGVAREAMVLAHEAMQGRFTRVGGSLMVMAERLGGASFAVMGLVGSFAMLTMGAMHLVEWLHKVSEAKLLAEAGALGSGVSQEDADKAVSALRGLSNVTTEEAGKIANAYVRMRGITAPILTELTGVTQQYAQRSGENTAAAAGKISAAFGLEATAAREVMENTRASEETSQQLNDAISREDTVKARTILLTELARSAHEVDTQTRSAAASQVSLSTSLSGMAAEAAPGLDVSQALNTNATIQQEANAARLKAALASVNAELKADAAQSWSEQMHTTLQKQVLETELDAQKQGKTWQQTHEDMARVEVDFWTKTLADTRDGTKAHEEAQRSLLTAQEQLAGLQIRLSTTTSKQEVEAKVTAISAEQAADRENLQKWLALEQQKLAILRQAYGEQSAEFQRELKAEETYQREHNDKMAAQTLAKLNTDNQVGKEHLQEVQADLQNEVAAEQLTKSAEVDLLAQATAQQYTLELQRLTAFIATLDQETNAYRQATSEKERLEAEFNATLARLRKERTQADMQAARQQEQEYVRAFDSMASSSQSAVGEIITGQTTVASAAQRIASQVVSQAASLAMHQIAAWAAMELAKTSATEAGAATRKAVEATQEAGGTGIATLLARWVGLERAKTLETGTQSVMRTAEEGTQNAAQTAGVVAAQGAQTGAVIAGGEAQNAATIAAKAEGIATSTALNAPVIMSDAAKAAAGAYSSVAQIPMVGWILAPAAAGVAFAAVAAYSSMASLDTGTSYVPHDMVAQIHEGEIVVPRYDADTLRSAGAAAGNSGAGAAGGDTHIHLHGPLVQAIDTQTGANFLKSNMRTIAVGIARQFNDNPSLRRK